MSDEKTGFLNDDVFRRFTRARQAEGGIKSQQRRGKPQHKWWGARWIAVLESFDIASRLERGRSYARKGQVLSIEIASGQVDAEVQGSRPKPYHVRLRMKTLNESDWQKLAKQFAAQALYAAKLLSGQMPEQIEQAFSDLGLTLFPKRHADLVTECNCPDWSNPCKHIAAVYYLLAEEFDRDPFLIFRLRGLDEDRLMQMLEKQLGAQAAAETEWQPGDLVKSQFDEPLSPEASRFWRLRPLPPNASGDLQPPQKNAVLPATLGAFPFWRGERDLWQTLEAVYKTASQRTSKDFADMFAENTDDGGLTP